MQKTRRDRQRRTRRNASTIGGAAPDTTIDRADADRSGARPYHATRAVSEACDAGRADSRLSLRGDSGRRAIETPGLGRDALPGEPPEGCPMVRPALAPLIVYAFRRVRRRTSAEGAK